MIRQPYSKGILARSLSQIERFEGITVSGHADIAVSASANAALFFNVFASASLPIISINPHIAQLNLSADVDVGLLELGDVRLGIKASADIFLSSVISSSKQNIVSASATLPIISLSNRISASARLPLIVSFATASSVISTTPVGWVTNLTLEESTKFTNYGFINIIRLGNNVYGVKSDGLYLLGASTDNSVVISSSIKTHPQNYKQQLFKRVPYMYIQTQYPVSVTSYVDNQTIGPMITDHGQQKVTMSKGTQGYYWSFKIASVSPNPFKIDGIEPFIDFMKRRA